MRTIAEVQEIIELIFINRLIPVYTRQIINSNLFKFSMFDGKEIFFTPCDSLETIAKGLKNNDYQVKEGL